MKLASAICVTAGRVSCLNEAIACFMAQSHTPKELIILNTLPAQLLVCDLPSVTILNPLERPNSLAAARNIAIRHSQGDILVTYDDDDGYGNDFLTEFAKHFTDGIDWVYQPRQFHVENGRIKSVVAGSCNVFAFTRKAFDALGGYQETLSVGEDRQFLGRLTSQFKGVKIPEEDFIPQFFYRWGSGAVEHISGHGDDSVGRTPAWERARITLDKKIKVGAIPTGRIELKPALKHDYGNMARQFIQTTKRAGAKGGIACVMLGRLGDIINILPVLRHIAESYAKPHLIVSREFLPLLDGISYVEPYPVDLPYDQILSAINLAEKEFAHVIVAQIWGKGWTQPKLTEAYNKEAWLQTGFLHRFDDPAWLPVFDQRNLAREKSLCVKLQGLEKPMLLVKLDGSVSSPCHDCPALLPLIVKRFGQDFNVINLSEVRSERIFDLLGLMDRAACLVSVDTSLLHLAGATTVPTVALVNPAQWLGTLPRCNCVRKLTYTEALAEPEKVLEAVTSAILQVERKEIAVVELRQPPARKLYHAVERHKQPPPVARKDAAVASWDKLYAQNVTACHLRAYPRDARVIGDKRALPYLRDVLAPALELMTDDDILIWTNDDVYLHPDLPEYLKFHVPVYGACTSQRLDFVGRIPLDRPRGKYVLRGRRHIGRDLLAATKKWFKEKWEQIGDPICGASIFDLHLASIVRLDYGIQTSRANIGENLFPAEIPLGYVAHQKHTPGWSNNANTPSEKHNKSNYIRWAVEFLPALKFDQSGCI